MKLLQFWTLSIVISFISNTIFRRLDLLSVFRWFSCSWAQSTELLPVSGHKHQYQIRFKGTNRIQTSSQNYHFPYIKPPYICGLTPIFLHCFTDTVVKVGELSE
jgi:hypothetical protein